MLSRDILNSIHDLQDRILENNFMPVLQVRTMKELFITGGEVQSLDGYVVFRCYHFRISKSLSPADQARATIRNLVQYYSEYFKVVDRCHAPEQWRVMPRRRHESV